MEWISQSTTPQNQGLLSEMRNLRLTRFNGQKMSRLTSDSRPNRINIQTMYIVTIGIDYPCLASMKEACEGSMGVRSPL